MVFVGLAQQSAIAAPGVIPQWIWTDRFPRIRDTAFLRKEFQIASPVAKAELRGWADDRMVVFLNGRQVAATKQREQLAPLDVSAALRQGVNVLAVQGVNEAGAAGVLLRLDLTDPQGVVRTVVTDATWRGTRREIEGWIGERVDPSAWQSAVSLGLLGVPPWNDPAYVPDDYNQWKKALGTGVATDDATVVVATGFRVELVRSSRDQEGSWVSLTFDPKGRAIIGREGKGLLRYTPGRETSTGGSMELIDDTLQECRGVLYAFDSLYANANNSKAIYRLRDTDGDDRFDDVKLLKSTPGGVGHGRNGLILGPDNLIYIIHGNNVELPEDYKPEGSPLVHYANVRLAPCAWDQSLFDFGVKPPYGHLIRMNADASRWELAAGGFRNPYGIGFNAEGELFTYDADNEGDMGTHWYRPTRINHIVSGGDYGFRQGSANRPGYYPEHPPTNLDIGKGSPTGAKFGTRSRFPERYRRSLFALDWAYGKIYAVEPIPSGASYVCRTELFVEGRPLNVTDLDFGPDGNLYFVTGGRGTQSGLYRVSFIGPLPEETDLPGDSAQAGQPAEARALRRSLEAFHTRQDAAALVAAWPHLDSRDPWIRYAGRLAVEFQPVETWQSRALAEQRPLGALTALLALARVGPPAAAGAILERLEAIDWPQAPVEQQLIALRICQLCCARPDGVGAAATQRLATRLESLYPADTFPVNRFLSELLAFLESPQLVVKSLALLNRAETQEERLYYLFALRKVAAGWTLDQRRNYFQWLRRADGFQGGSSMLGVITSIRNEALGTLSEAEKTSLGELLYPVPLPPLSEDPAAKRPFVQDWKLPELVGALDAVGKGRNFERAKSLYAATLCIRCHKLGDQGTAVGPDLAGLGGRFSRRDILESILNPSKVVDEKYRNAMIETKSGKVVVGRVAGGDETSLVVITDPLAPGKTLKLLKGDIEFESASMISPMPVGLLNTLTKEEILDLLAYLQAGGNPQHPNFQP